MNNGIDLFEVAARMSAIAASKNWDPPTWDGNFVSKLAFVLTELDEAVQYVDGTGKDPVEVELADTAIRLLAVLHGIWGSDWSASRIANRRPPVRRGVYAPLEVAVWPIIRQICGAIEAWRKNDPVHGKKDAMIGVELAVLETFRLADQLNIDLLEHIERKAAKNATRPPNHGLGRSVG